MKRYFYEGHMGSIYSSECVIDDDLLYCETCGDSDWPIGEASSQEEAEKLLIDHYTGDNSEETWYRIKAVVDGKTKYYCHNYDGITKEQWFENPEFANFDDSIQGLQDHYDKTRNKETISKVKDITIEEFKTNYMSYDVAYLKSVAREAFDKEYAGGKDLTCLEELSDFHVNTNIDKKLEEEGFEFDGTKRYKRYEVDYNDHHEKDHHPTDYTIVVEIDAVRKDLSFIKTTLYKEGKPYTEDRAPYKDVHYAIEATMNDIKWDFVNKGIIEPI